MQEFEFDQNMKNKKESARSRNRQKRIIVKKKAKRKARKARIKAGKIKFLKDAITKQKKLGNDYLLQKKFTQKYTPKRPDYPTNSSYLFSITKAFSDSRVKSNDSNIIGIPKTFSLAQNPEESFLTLKKLLYQIYKSEHAEILIDYSQCQTIELDASVCMDIIIMDFNFFIQICKKRRYNHQVKSLRPVNFNRPEIVKILFSIGAFRNIRGFKIDYPDISTYNLCIRNKMSPNASAQREIDITRLVEYITSCIHKMGKTLSDTAEKNLYDVIGEILINAEEHSTTQNRFSIGYFHENKNMDENIGTFHFVIFNFGNTIYEKFKDEHCPNQEAVKQMLELSKNYTKKSLFKTAEFEEETLWTLYALQEGVTSKSNWRRGNGSIRFIESFFNLKGDLENDKRSKLTIISGNTRIEFDGSYRIIEKVKGKEKKPYKIMAFNETGDINEKPDKNFVNFTKNYFPGTMISAKICIKPENVAIEDNIYESV